MLVISRKKLESLFIGDDIKIVIVAINGNNVRLAIDAPRNVTVLRSELATTGKEQRK